MYNLKVQIKVSGGGGGGGGGKMLSLPISEIMGMCIHQE